MAQGIDSTGGLETLPTLQELLSVLCRGLPAYLAEARPWAQAGSQRVGQALENLVADQQRYARRVANAIVARGGRPDPGPFPARFASKNDLSFDFLLRDLIDDQQRAVATLERCVDELGDASSLRFLVEEVLGNARGHLDIFQEIGRDKRGATFADDR